MTDLLRECPFCGMKPHPAVDGKFVRGIAWRMHHECPALGVRILIDGNNAEAVHAIWQVRHQPEVGAVTVDDAMVERASVAYDEACGNDPDINEMCDETAMRIALTAALMGKA